MCGIVGVLGPQDAVDRILDGLKRLEYRGYDSAGIAVVCRGEIVRRRAAGKVQALEDRLKNDPLPEGATVGIGHTRWATHGASTEDNAHPHSNGRVAVVHNGIIENFPALKAEYQTRGCVFETQTDTEVVVHILTRFLDEGLTPAEAVQAMVPLLEGAFALGIVFRDHPDLIIGVRQGAPLAVGTGDAGVFLGSDALTLGPWIREIAYLDDGDHVILHGGQARVLDRFGQPADRPFRPCSLANVMVGKQNYRHFMLKEIHEQPLASAEALRAWLGPNGSAPPDGKAFGVDWTQVRRLCIVACGTSLYAGHIARYWFEMLCGLPVDVEIASEFRYRTPPVDPDALYLFISQSGETVDTLAACLYIGDRAVTAALVNVTESSLARSVRHVWPIHSGPEIGVASTKAMMNQLVVLACLAASAMAAGRISKHEEAVHAWIRALEHIPALITSLLALDAPCQQWAARLRHARSVLYLGRGCLFPVALEGALKLKELSYIHAEGFAAGEMKHGPIALIDENVPVIMLCPSGPMLTKTLANMHEVKARGGQVMLMTDAAGAAQAGDDSLTVMTLPEAPRPLLTPFTHLVPLQLVAYHTAVLAGCDVDQPRNLAKSVTVE